VNLPILTRNLNGLLNLVPGSKSIAVIHPVKRNYGSVSFSGSTGRNSIQVVDGGDNRDNIVGGPLLVFTLEGIEEFQVAQHQFSAADGRSSGAAANVVTKSGTNALKGSGFLFDREKALTAKDYFTKRDGLLKLSFSRQQFGGSVGGPSVPNWAFFFGPVERIQEDTAVTIPEQCVVPPKTRFLLEALMLRPTMDRLCGMSVVVSFLCSAKTRSTMSRRVVMRRPVQASTHGEGHPELAWRRRDDRHESRGRCTRPPHSAISDREYLDRGSRAGGPDCSEGPIRPKCDGDAAR
jgi:hypothetical protein